MNNYPILQALKPYKEHFNVKHFLSLPTDTPYGNLVLTYTEIVTQVECLNGLIMELFVEYHRHEELVKIRGGWSNIDESFKYKFQTEQIIYWLHKTTDEFISIFFILKHFKKTGKYPDRIDISSIGKLLNRLTDLENSTDIILQKHLELLKMINEISNAFKHTLLNAQLNAHRGLNEPVVFALSAYNIANHQPKFYRVGLKTLLKSYDEFLKDIRDVLELKYVNINDK